MKTKDFVISPVGVEDPKLHSVAINDQLINAAIELRGMVLIGASYNSINSEYRRFNAKVSVCNQLMKNNKLYNQFKKIVFAEIKKDSLKIGNNEIKNVMYHGLDYLILYYLLLKSIDSMENQLIAMNSFTTFAPMVIMFDQLTEQAGIKLSQTELSSLMSNLIKFEGFEDGIGSKLLTVNKNQVEHVNDLSCTIWKSMYINHILRNLPETHGSYLFTPSIDWGLIRGVSKHLFTNNGLLTKIKYSENIRYIQSTSEKQRKLSLKLMDNNQDLRDIKELTTKLQEITRDLDYVLDDLMIVVFYSNGGNTLYKEMVKVFDESSSMNKLSLNSLGTQIITSIEIFKHIIFQYLYGVFLLNKQGIIHNDPHLNNILLSKNTSNKRYKYIMTTGEIIAFKQTPINLSIIDFDKSILSHHHHDKFDENMEKINEEMGIVFGSIKKTISSDYEQVFTCYAMYDIVRFGLIMNQLLSNTKDNIGDYIAKSSLDKHEEFLDKMIKLAMSVMSKIYDTNPKFPFKRVGLHSGVEWLIVNLFNSNIAMTTRESDSSHVMKITTQLSNEMPEFVSSRRKYMDALKYEYLTQYVMDLKKSQN